MSGITQRTRRPPPKCHHVVVTASRCSQNWDLDSGKFEVPILTEACSLPRRSSPSSSSRCHLRVICDIGFARFVSPTCLCGTFYGCSLSSCIKFWGHFAMKCLADPEISASLRGEEGLIAVHAILVEKVLFLLFAWGKLTINILSIFLPTIC
jgi:hypothetical protein